MLSNLNRSAITVQAKKPFYDWLKACDPESTGDPSDELMAPDVILLPDFETRKEIEEWLQKNYDLLFEEKLSGWYLDEELWPEKRDYLTFLNWFHVTFHTMVFDADDSDYELF